MAAIDRLAQAGRWRHLPLAEKALLALGLLTLAMVLPPWPGGALVLAAAVAAAILAAGVPLGAWLRLAAGPAAFVATAVVPLLLDWGSHGPQLAVDGGRAALAAGLRSGGAVASLLLLAATTPAAELVQGARRLGLPAELADVALATYRFVFVLQDTAEAMWASQAARLGHAGPRRRIHSAGLLASALLPRALERARRLEAGLAARGFDGTLPTLQMARPISSRRVAAIVALLAGVAGMGAWAG